MDQRNSPDSSKPASDSAPEHATLTPNHCRNSQLLREREKERGEGENEDLSAARKVLKADREKLRRDRLNEHFQELGNTLDPDRPKNDKATILTETIQMLKDLTAEVSRLKTEHKALSEESRELMQEKNELREEKTSLKSDIENLNAQYQQRVRIMFPWTAMDHSVVISPPYSYPLPIPIPPAPISIHPSLQPFPFFANQNPAHIPNPCSIYVPYSTPTNPPLEPPSALYAQRCNHSHDVATELELKMPGSSSTQPDCSSGGRKGKHSVMKDRTIKDGSSSSQYSSSQGLQDSSNSVSDIPKTDN
ncbi:Transcription factor bHLH121, partial [Mucuna pruriens]